MDRAHIAPRATRNASWLCHICAKSFRSKDAYDSHMNVHNNVDTSTQCELCGKWVFRMAKHRRRMHGELQSCTLCDRQYRGAEGLRVHMRAKHSALPDKYQCIVCEKRLPSTTAFRDHMAMHNRERSYTCTFCPKTFLYNHDFYVHRIRKHPEEYARLRGKKNVLLRRPDKKTKQQLIKENWRQMTKVTCAECNQEMLASSLSNHMRMKHAQHSHVCAVCQKAFVFRYLLQDHMIVHDGNLEHRHICNYCPAKFARYDAKFAHQKKQHLAEWLADKQKREAKFIRNQAKELEEDTEPIVST